MNLIQFNVIFERDEDGYYVASVPSIPGCYTQGKTLEIAKKRIQEAIKLCHKKD
jgi:predicted RNase H-like HicB family nuclease